MFSYYVSHDSKTMIEGFESHSRRFASDSCTKPENNVKFGSQTTKPNIYLNFFLLDFDNFKRFLACSIPVTGKLLESISPICTNSDA
jgi:hypothetical protein